MLGVSVQSINVKLTREGYTLVFSHKFLSDVWGYKVSTFQGQIIDELAPIYTYTSYIEIASVEKQCKSHHCLYTQACVDVYKRQE